MIIRGLPRSHSLRPRRMHTHTETHMQLVPTSTCVDRVSACVFKEKYLCDTVPGNDNESETLPSRQRAHSRNSTDCRDTWNIQLHQSTHAWICLRMRRHVTNIAPSAAAAAAAAAQTRVINYPCTETCEYVLHVAHIDM